MSLAKGLVSIVTPAFNSAKLIGATIESAIAQTYADWEMIVVMDSGTKDNTAEVVLNYARKDPRIRLIEIIDARGISLSRNRALSEARGQYIAFLDSDDIWLPAKLEEQIKFMKHNAYAFACAGYRRINVDHSEEGKLILPPQRQTYGDVLKNNLIACPTVLIDQIQTGPLVMAEFSHEDYILWLDILKRGFDCGGLRMDLARYRIVPNSRSMNVNRSGSRWKVYRKFEGLGIFMASYCFAVYAFTALWKRLRF
jgi:teichuronic acid biosynthesis glycosyltransferase TuaG